MTVFSRSLRIIREQGPRVYVGKVMRAGMRPVRVLRAEGPRVFLVRALTKASTTIMRHETVMLVSNEDAAQLDWTQPPPWRAKPILNLLKRTSGVK